MHGAAMKEAVPQRRSADVDIAVLQVQMSNLEERVVDLKDGLKDIRDAVAASQHLVSKEIAALSVKHETAHKALATKIVSLEKWRWMIVTGGAITGTILWNVATHWETIVKFIK